jgi:HEAT repeat protein
MGKLRFRLGVLVFLLLPSPQVVHGQQQSSASKLLQQFETEKMFWPQFQVAKEIVATNDPSVLPRLEPWLTHPNRHSRGNAAFIFAKLGDPRGFDVIVAILGDHSAEREIHRISSAGTLWVQGQIMEDRYYAAHLLGDLQDVRALPILTPLLTDPDVHDIVPWSLGQIASPSAIQALIGSTSDRDASMRVLAIYALAELKATEALPRLRELLGDDARSNFGRLESVSEAAQAAIAKLQSETAR